MAIYAASQTCSEQVMFLVSPRFASHTTSFISTAPPPTISPKTMQAHLDDLFDIGAQIETGSLCRARVFRDRPNPLTYPDEKILGRGNLLSLSADRDRRL